MKQTVFKPILIGIFAILIQSCHKDPVFLYGYIHSSEVQKKLMEGVSGTYSGKMICIGSAETQPDAESVRKTTEDVRYTVDGYQPNYGSKNAGYITIHNYPVSLIGYTVTNPELATVLKAQPNRDLQIRFWIGDPVLSGEENKTKGTINFEYIPVNLSLEYGGMLHNVLIKLGGNNALEIDGEKESTWSINALTFSVSSISVDGKLKQEYEQWEKKSSEFYTFIRGKRD